MDCLPVRSPVKTPVSPKNWLLILNLFSYVLEDTAYVKSSYVLRALKENSGLYALAGVAQ